MRKRLQALRDELLDEIRKLLPKDGFDNPCGLRYCTPVKRIDGDGEIVLYSQRDCLYRPDDIEDMPTDALVDLYERLKDAEV